MSTRTLSVLGSTICLLGELGAAYLIALSIATGFLLHAAVYVVVLGVLVLADHVLFPLWRRRGTGIAAIDDRRRLDAATRFGSSRTH